MSKPKQTKVYKEAVKKMTAQVDQLRSGVWQGSAVSTPAPVPTSPRVGGPLGHANTKK